MRPILNRPLVYDVDFLFELDLLFNFGHVSCPFRKLVGSYFMTFTINPFYINKYTLTRSEFHTFFDGKLLINYIC